MAEISFDREIYVSEKDLDRLLDILEEGTPLHPDIRLDLMSDERMEANRKSLEKFAASLGKK